MTLGLVEGLELRLGRESSAGSRNEVKRFRYEICWKVEGMVWKERDGDGTILSEGQEERFTCRRVFVYI